MPGLRFRSLADGDRALDVAEIRQQIAEWSQARRIVVDVAAPDTLKTAQWMVADRVLDFLRPGDAAPAVERLAPWTCRNAACATRSPSSGCWIRVAP